MQVEPGDAPAALEEDIMVAAHVQPFHLCEQRFLAALGRIQRKGDVLAVGKTARLVIDEMPNLVPQVRDE